MIELVIGLAVGIIVAFMVRLLNARMQRDIARRSRPSRIRELEHLNARLDEYIADVTTGRKPRRPPPEGLVRGYVSDLPPLPLERPDRSY